MVSTFSMILKYGKTNFKESGPRFAHQELVDRLNFELSEKLYNISLAKFLTFHW